MTNFRQVQDERVRKLAETLRNNGLAASETEAIRMAESMTKTESKVNQHFDENKDNAPMVKPIDRPERDPNTPNQAVDPQPAQQIIRDADSSSDERQSQQLWEKEAMAQDSPAKQGPAPTHSTGAIAEAINNVKQQFSEGNQPTQQVDFATNEGATLSEAAEEEAPDAPEGAQEEGAPAVIEEPTAEEAPVAEQPTEEPVAPAEIQQEPTMQEPVATEEAPAEPVAEQPAQEEMFSVQEEAPAAEQPPVQEPMAQPAVEQPAQEAEPEGQPETTREIPAEPSEKKDLSKYAESKISLADVFDFTKQR